MSILTLAVALVVASPTGDPVGPSGGPIAAPSAKAAVLPLQVDGELPTKWKKSASERLLRGLARGSVELVPPDAVGTATCADADCYQNIGTKTGAQYVVETTLSVQAGRRDYTVSLRVLSAQDGEEVATATATCELCGFEEAIEALESKAASVSGLIGKLQLAAPVYRLTSDPPGARIEIDGEVVGQAPLTISLSPGEHSISATSGGFREQVLEVEAVQGVSKGLVFELVPVRKAAVPQPTENPQAKAMVVSGSVLVGLGLAAVGGGATLVALHGRPHRGDCQEDPEGDCRFLYGTRTPGAVTLAVGVLGLGVGAALLVVGKRRGKRASEAQVQVSGAGLVGRF